MADEGTAKQRERVRESVRIEFVPKEKMPDGCRVVPLMVDGALVWGVLENEMTNELRMDFNSLLDYIMTCGLYRQNWTEGEMPPVHPR
ncbi:hypothetical protein [Streptomyces sp. NPDC056069]|uniref:hypothetical protein n=1 Tax=Streptomyces sp. NPDC056069 TaxID=3345702 RepID=UPI0035E2A144